MTRRFWPTPTSDTSLRTGRYKQGGQSLGHAVQRSEASSPGSVVSTSALSGPDGRDDGRSNGTTIAPESSLGTGPMFPELETSGTPTPSGTALWPTPVASEGGEGRNPNGRGRKLHIEVVRRVSHPSTSSPAASPASRSAWLGSGKGQMTSDGSGLSSSEPFALLIPESSSSRTFRAFCPPEEVDERLAAYVAGLVDGDGTIGLQRGRTTQMYPRVAIRLGWKGRSVLTSLQETFGGHCGEEKRAPNPKHTKVYLWSVVGKNAVRVLQVIYPWLRVKQPQAAVALHAADFWASGVKGRYSTMLRYQELIRVLNQRGPEYALPALGRWLVLPEIDNSRGTPSLRWPQTWPAAGSTRSGTAFQLPPSVPRTSVTGSGSSHIPTPTATDGLMFHAPERLEAGEGSSPASLTRRSGADRSNDRLDHAVMATDGGSLNPAWVSALMGFPPDWTEVE